MEASYAYGSICMGLQCRRRGHNSSVVRARASNGREYPGKLVDESMIVLRLRIKEMKMLDNNPEPPSFWMHWEKQCYDHYDEHICNAIALLQSYLMVTRPSVALGMLTRVAFSLPITSVTLFFFALHMANTF
ncbi:hypothetical protein VNO78_14715 [Psophocarpus tetragonolobus]|uniref:Uncharacterized protein n=1 Tax=Psophocarpus tetragonolobus TaxID=3891 RepID=A0AAN9SCT9_PSOTE